MKEVIAVIRPSRAKWTKQKLAEKGFNAYTEERVLGCGKQKGLRYSQNSQDESAGVTRGGIPFLPKRMLTLFVNDEDLDVALAVLIESNKTGEIGDGKIFICPMEDAVRIRTDERNRTALV